MKTTIKFNTQNDEYKVETIDFIISTNKITCIGNVTIYNKEIIGTAKGTGFNCSESFMMMLDSIPRILSEYEKSIVADSVGDDSFESNTNANDYVKLEGNLK